jgi:single-strand DNA-binding protein
MGSLNRVTLVGNLGRDAEVKFTEGGQSVTGEKKEKTEWHRIVLWGKQAETLQPYLVKGKQICVEGRLETRQWEKDGQKHYTTEIRADHVVLLGGGDGRGEQVAAPEHITADLVPF